MPDDRPGDLTSEAVARLLEEQRALRETVETLVRRIEILEGRRASTTAAAPPAISPVETPDDKPALPTRRPAPPTAVLSSSPTFPAAPPVPAGSPAPVPPPLPAVSARSVAEAPHDPDLPPVPSLEMRIGGTWLVRVGIVALLTGFVFLGGYLYQFVVPHLGPAGKVALLYLGAGMLTGLGAWLERSARDGNAGFLDYARVVFGGGLAAVYYVTYLAHHGPGLRVIESALLAAGLQLAWAGFMVWLADRRESQTLATFAIFLGYYTSAVSGVETFTLFSNLALAGAAVYLLSRHRWTAFSFASLIATYGSYVFWRYARPPGSGWREGGPFWIELIFFSLYWALFTLVVFRSTGGSLPPGRRATFATLNNGAFFALAAARLQALHPGDFWILCGVFGGVLVALGQVGRRIRGTDPVFAGGNTSSPGAGWVPLDAATAAAFRLLGLVLITLGVLNYFSGWNLALALAAESVVLTLAARSQPHDGRRLLPAAACGAGLLACGVLLDRLGFGGNGERLTATGSLTECLVGGGVAAAFLFNAFWSRRDGTPDPNEQVPPGTRDWLPRAAAVFSGLAALALLGVIDTQALVPLGLRPAALAAAAVGLTALAHPLALGPLAGFAQGLQLAAIYRWAEFWPGTRSSLPAPWWSAAIVTAGGFLLSTWWQRQRRFAWQDESRRVWVPLSQAWLAVAAIGILYGWLQPHFSDPAWMALCGALGVGIFIGGLLTQSWAIAAASQLFLAAAAGYFASGLTGALSPRPGRWLMLVPVAAFLVVPTVARRLHLFWKLAGEGVPVRARTALLPIGVGYEIVAALMFLGWTEHFVAARAQFSVLALGGAAVFALSHLRRTPRWLVFGGGLTLAGVCAFAFHEIRLPLVDRFSWWQLGAIGLLAAQQSGARRVAKLPPGLPPVPGAATAPQPPPLPLPEVPAWAHQALMIAVVACAWRWLTNLLGLTTGGALYLVVGWSLFAAALFAAGLLLRERTYRWLGLAVLATTLARVGIVEFWQADTLERILGLLALGGVLLGLGFVYNRYSAKLREWL